MGELEAEVLKEDVLVAKTDEKILEESKKEEKMLKRINDNGVINLVALSDKEKEKYSKLNASLKINDINSVSSFGQELQSSMTKYSDSFLKTVRTSSIGELGTMIDDLLDELGYIDIKDFDEVSPFKKAISKIPLLRKLMKNVDKVMHKYDDISTNVDTISKKITAMRMLSLKENNNLQNMFENNMVYLTQIEEIIIAGKIKSKEIEDELNNMQANADVYSAQEIQDVQVFKNNLDKRLSDLLTLRFVIRQSLPQIRTVQYNNLSIADKAQSLISTTIPVWRNQLSIAVALNNQKNSIDAQRKISDTTNKILMKNAELLKSNSVYVAKENERSVVDIETLRNTTEKLIETIKEVKSIHEEAAKNRENAEKELMKLEENLESSMTSIIVKH